MTRSRLGLGLGLGSIIALALGCSPPPERISPPPPEPPPPELVAAVNLHVAMLAAEIGGRSLARPGSLEAAAAYLRREWERQGFTVAIQTYDVDGTEVANLAVEIPGRRPELVVVGAHYDTCLGYPGADDNASGVAALLELSRRLRGTTPELGIRLVAFANEEPPYFQDPETMGSSVYARSLRAEGREVVAMLSLESIGYFRDEPGSQHYPKIVAPLYPDTGNFIAVVGNNRSRPLVGEIVDGLERHGPVPVESIAAPASITGIDWSDHWSFWQAGWPAAVMITDTAVFRNPHYHEPSDTPDTLDYRRLAWVVVALDGTIRELAGIE